MSKGNTKEAHDRKLEIEADFLAGRPKMPEENTANTSGGWNAIKGPAYPGLTPDPKTVSKEVQREALRTDILPHVPVRIQYKRNPRLGTQKVK